MSEWFDGLWQRFKLWLVPPMPVIGLPAPVAVIAPPRGFKSWFAWEAVEYTAVPSAFWLDPFRFGHRPTPEEEREAQDRLAAMFGLKVVRPLEYHPMQNVGMMGMLQSYGHQGI